jgi:predicted amidohydrolase YtcJ
VIDDPGLTVLPACDDTHTHLLFAGRAASDVQVADARNLGEFLDLIRRRAAAGILGPGTNRTDLPAARMAR